MLKQKTKTQIIHTLETERKRLEANLSTLTPTEMLEPGVVGEWSVKDILAHLADWEAHMPEWVGEARRGAVVETPEHGHSWDHLDVFNETIYERHRGQPLEVVLGYFHDTHLQFMEMVSAMPEAEMLTPGYYTFTGKSAIWDWLKAYANHDLWAKTKLRKWMKSRL
ncbi:MAG: glyoxalase/bleomycin resistance protein/dihydroxybiphenyl dioxygenase [Chloroflexi bacterium]|nr:glyoxalase/bleomycin resistance protein/dihydroxybiphenyl dioxygenase [Chloroflexota bacterium]